MWSGDLSTLNLTRIEFPPNHPVTRLIPATRMLALLWLFEANHAVETMPSIYFILACDCFSRIRMIVGLSVVPIRSGARLTKKEFKTVSSGKTSNNVLKISLLDAAFANFRD
jgi:hypothetical protein